MCPICDMWAWWAGILFVKTVCCECSLASPAEGTGERNCEPSTVLPDQYVFCVWESVYRDGKQNR